jgi:hypothetical protein
MEGQVQGTGCHTSRSGGAPRGAHGRQGGGLSHSHAPVGSTVAMHTSTRASPPWENSLGGSAQARANTSNASCVSASIRTPKGPRSHESRQLPLVATASRLARASALQRNNHGAKAKGYSERQLRAIMLTMPASHVAAGASARGHVPLRGVVGRGAPKAYSSRCKCNSRVVR